MPGYAAHMFRTAHAIRQQSLLARHLAATGFGAHFGLFGLMFAPASLAGFELLSKPTDGGGFAVMVAFLWVFEAALRTLSAFFRRPPRNAP